MHTSSYSLLSKHEALVTSDIYSANFDKKHYLSASICFCYYINNQNFFLRIKSDEKS